MEMQPLFLDSTIEIPGKEKLAGMMIKLSDNVDTWPQEITQEAYKQLPYLSGFDVHIILDRVDEERGYAFGSIEVTPKTEMNTKERGLYKMSKAHIPIIVKDQMLSPLDVFMTGRTYHHLTEDKLRESLFRPALFDGVREKPRETSLIHELVPPQTYGGYSTGIKAASVQSFVPILPMLSGTVLEEHKNRFLKEASDPSIRAKISEGDEGMQAAFASASNLEVSDLKKFANTVWESIPPDVVQIRKLDNGKCMVKWANTDMFSPQEQEVDPGTAQELIGDQDLVARMESDGSITASPEAAAKDTLDAEEVKNADQFGLWNVQDTTGNVLTGWVFPTLLSMDMQPLPLSLFNNGSQFALQEMIAGKFVSKSTDIPRGVPQGYGALYYIDHGTAKAFVPMTITSTFSGPTGQVSYVGQCGTGEQVTISFSEGLKVVTKVGEMEYAVPATFCWMPLKAKVELVAEPMMFSKTANKDWAGTVEIVGDGDVYSFRGPSVVKIAEEHTKFIDRDKAEFLGAALGMIPNFVKESLDKASSGDLVTVPGVKVLGTVSEKIASARKNVREHLDNLPHPIKSFSLVKEAAFLNDALTTDKILGLGFLNAENVATFVDMLPCLEETSSKIAELLIAIRIGLSDVPEVAAERMLVAMEDVIKGLKALQQKELTFAE